MRPVYSVTSINQYIRRMFLQDLLLSDLSVKGEVSNLKYHSSGHIYFSLKDEGAVLSCVMFRSNRKGLAFPLKDGDKVEAVGSIEVYERNGSYQLYAREIRLEGAGFLYEQFEKRKAELAEMGMFDPMYKQEIGRYNRRIGIVTAETGAAIRDIETIARRRNPYVQLILYPALVQGDGAKESICKGIAMLDDAGVDVIIVGRGGGSIEDLWAFNEEEVARAIFECKTPVISAVGHETDTTIADFVADLRAPTPSAAAELAVFDYESFRNDLAGYREHFRNRLCQSLTLTNGRRKEVELRLRHVSPAHRLLTMRQRAEDLRERLREVCQNATIRNRERSEKCRSSLTGGMQLSYQRADIRRIRMIERWKGKNPLDRLLQGFSYVSAKDGKGIRSIGQVRPKDPVTIHVVDGRIEATVNSTKKEERL